MHRLRVAESENRIAKVDPKLRIPVVDSAKTGEQETRIVLFRYASVGRWAVTVSETEGSLRNSVKSPEKLRVNP